MSKLTDTQDAAIQHHFTEYTEDTWDNMMNDPTNLEPEAMICDWFKDNSSYQLKEMLICLEQMLQDFYNKGKLSSDAVWRGRVD